MAKRELHESAIDMRKQGMSYTAIRERLGVSKSTLSTWLKDMPLTDERTRELQGLPRRIERIRESKRIKREQRHAAVRDTMGTEIGSLSTRELFIGGLILYWAEGTKVRRDDICITNTDPAMMQFFISWLALCGIEKRKIRIKLHLYKDMDLEKEQTFWLEVLGLSANQLIRPYIKESECNKRKNYKGRFEHGTCNLFVSGRDLYEKTLLGMDYIRKLYGGLPMSI